MPDHDARTSDHDALDERLRAVERALTDADDDLTDLRDAAATARELDALSDRLDETEERLDELDAATQALRGYVGNVRAVNRSVEQTANAALAKVQEREPDGLDSGRGGLPDERPTASTDRQATTPDRSCECAPCGCATRRAGRTSASETPNCPTDQPEAPNHPSDQPEETGLVGRVASVLASALTGPSRESR